MSIGDGVSSWCDEFGVQVDLIRLIMATSPLASVFNSEDGLLSSEFTEPTLVPHARGVALSLTAVRSKTQQNQLVRVR
jgi:hypothetical protein